MIGYSFFNKKATLRAHPSVAYIVTSTNLEAYNFT